MSRLDARHSGGANDHTGIYGMDPLAVKLIRPFTKANTEYLRHFQKIPVQPRPYQVSARETPHWRWNWNVWGDKNIPSGGRYINVMPNLQRTLNDNANLRVMVASGYYDFATPFFASENDLAELISGSNRVDHRFYKAGQMIYLDEKSRMPLTSRIRKFINNQQ